VKILCGLCVEKKKDTETVEKAQRNTKKSLKKDSVNLCEKTLWSLCRKEEGHRDRGEGTEKHKEKP